MSILHPHNDTLISMARLVYEASDLSFLNVSFHIHDSDVVVMLHDDDKVTSEIYESVTIPELVASYLGLSIPLDLDANDKVTTGHRLGRTYRRGGK